MRTKAVLFFLLLLPVYVVNGQDDKREYLKKVLDNLEQIKSATYKVEAKSGILVIQFLPVLENIW